MAAAADRRRLVAQTFRLHGLSTKPEATRFLLDTFRDLDEQQLEANVTSLVEMLLRSSSQLQSNLVDRAVCEAALRECRTDATEHTPLLALYDAFSVPRFRYAPDRKKLVLLDALSSPEEQANCRLHPEAAAKSRLFRERYAMIRQRIMRHPQFAERGLGTGSSYQLRPVEFLLGAPARLAGVFVLGMLTQAQEGRWHLEDVSGSVALDLSATWFHPGLFVESCFVLAEGHYDDDVFHVAVLELPPGEAASVTRASFGDLNLFGGKAGSCAAASAHLKQLEARHDMAMIVLLSDVHLDDESVLLRLRLLLQGFAQHPPVAFVLCGNFSSSVAATGRVQRSAAVARGLRRLAELLEETPALLAQSHFVLVPGPEDPGLGRVLPRPPLPAVLTKEFAERVPHALMASNPCRLQFCAQEIVLFREEVSSRMLRYCLHAAMEEADDAATTDDVGAAAGCGVPKYLVQTLVSQAHLLPLPLHISPVYWAHDGALRLYPLPRLLMLADSAEAYQLRYCDMLAVNPGSFAAHGAFKVYYPHSGTLEDSRVAAEAAASL